MTEISVNTLAKDLAFPIIAILGPTATGKSSLAVSVAERLLKNGITAEVINADAYQLYQGMNIGTAKITSEEMCGIPHHLLDIKEVSQEVTVAEYQQLAREKILDLQRQQVLPILVGGSGLYLRSTLDEMDFQPTDLELRAALEARLTNEGSYALFQELLAKDPKTANRIDSRNGRRIVRALEVISLTGGPYQSELPELQYWQPTIQIGLDASRKWLDPRLALRVDLMAAKGLLSEVEELSKIGFSKTAARAVGYAELLSYLKNECTLQEAFEKIKINTRKLTRKQMGWFGRDLRINWFDAQKLSESDQAITEIESLVFQALETGEIPETKGSDRIWLGSSVS